jgi:hypothetical protein
MKEIPTLLVLTLFAAALVCGCAELNWVLGTGEEMACSGTAVKIANVDPDHCYQDAAIRKSDTELCEKIESPPPRTKCYMLIAEKDGDKDICEKMQNYPGPGEYSRLECLQMVAVKTNNPAVCDLMGTASVSYMFTGEVSKQSCCKAVSSGCSASVEQIYNKNTENFRQCQDLAYAAVFNKAPSTTEGSSKKEIGEKLLSSSYTVTAKGCVAEGASPSIPLSDGDVIVFGWDSLPDPKDGAHYAVAEKGKISQVLNFAKGGAFNQTGDISWFFSKRTVYDPYNNNNPMTSPNVYHCYTVYHRTSGSK